MQLNSLITIMDWVTIVFAFFAMFGSFYSMYRHKKHQQMELKKIKIIFYTKDKRYLLDVDIPRKHISRSEIQGILAAFQLNVASRYSLLYLSEIHFLNDIFAIQNGKLDRLIIKLTPREMKQFNRTKMIKI